MDQSQVARQTLQLLEGRLNKVKNLLYEDNEHDGNDRHNTPASSSISARLQSIEKALNSLETNSASVRELLRLREQFHVLVKHI